MPNLCTVVSCWKHPFSMTAKTRTQTFDMGSGTGCLLQIFAVNDDDSARLASDLLGQGMVVHQTTRQAMDSDRSGLTYAERHSGRPLLTSDEVRNLPCVPPTPVSCLDAAGLRRQTAPLCRPGVQGAVLKRCEFPAVDVLNAEIRRTDIRSTPGI